MDAPTFEESEYPVEDWEHVLEPFETHSQLHGENTGIDETQPSKQAIYYIDSELSAGIWIELHPDLRSQEGLMLKGTIDLETLYSNHEIQGAHRDILDKHKKDYHTDPVSEEEIAGIEIPERYDQTLLKETLDATVDMIKDVEELQDNLSRTVTEYRESL